MNVEFGSDAIVFFINPDSFDANATAYTVGLQLLFFNSLEYSITLDSFSPALPTITLFSIVKSPSLSTITMFLLLFPCANLFISVLAFFIPAAIRVPPSASNLLISFFKVVAS